MSLPAARSRSIALNGVLSCPLSYGTSMPWQLTSSWRRLTSGTYYLIKLYRLSLITLAPAAAFLPARHFTLNNLPPKFHFAPSRRPKP